MSEFVYNGLWLSPEAKYARDCLEKSQELVTGKVVVQIGPGHVRALAREAADELYNESLVSMDVHGGYNPGDATGFIGINSIRIKEYVRAFGPYTK